MKIFSRHNDVPFIQARRTPYLPITSRGLDWGDPQVTHTVENGRDVICYSLVSNHLYYSEYEKGMLFLDYSNEEIAQTYLTELIERLLSDKPGCYNFDGIKFDWPFLVPHNYPYTKRDWVGKETPATMPRSGCMTRPSRSSPTP